MQQLLTTQAGPYKGIINHLFNQNKEKLIKVESSSNFTTSYYPLTIVKQHDDRDHWASISEDQPYIEITFIRRKLTITDYTIKSHWQDTHMIRSWKLEGSNDPIEWHELHRKENTEDMSNLANKTYSITSLPKPYNHYKFTMLEKTKVDSVIRINRIEFYGLIDASKDITCNHNRNNDSLLPLLSVFLFCLLHLTLKQCILSIVFAAKNSIMK